MAPPSKSRRRSKHPHPDPLPGNAQSDDPVCPELFVDPMLGAPLSIYIDNDVPDRNRLAEVVKKHGGHVASGYSSVPYILVDPTNESGRALYLQYAGKKGKVVLNARWVYKCVDAGQLQSYHNDFAGCKVTGNERITNASGSRGSEQTASTAQVAAPSRGPQQDHMITDVSNQHSDAGGNTLVGPQTASHHQQSTALLHHNALIFPSETRQHVASGPPAQSAWAAAGLPSGPSRPVSYQAGPGVPPWNEPFDSITHTQSQPYDFPYRSEDHWTHHTSDFYTQPFDPNVAYQAESQPYPAVPPQAGMQHRGGGDSERGRRRHRPPPAPPSDGTKKPRFTVSTNTHERSPTPPSRVLKSTHGGNHFTDDDVKYLGRYIDYCRRNGLPLSLREICERLALKAPHHTFYSWRRYCNKHQIRLGGYEMEEPTPSEGSDRHLNEDHDTEMSAPEPTLAHSSGPSQPQGAPSELPVQATEMEQAPRASRDRSPSPPRLLFRSTTGKGVAFTQADVAFLMRYLEYYRAQHEDLNMVQFWKRIAAKAPHHSRASWMKYWRRHRHELDGSSPVIPRPEKKRKYDSNDDLLLARYFAKKPVGTSDAIFQAFARDYPHHPWKGWQEHHRIHKAKIEDLVQQIQHGEINNDGARLDHTADDSERP